MNKTVSANTLFHFTNSMDNLKGILTHGFYPCYSIEDLSVFVPKDIFKEEIRHAIPMVSFCDIPF
jgi:hypothetical protein